MSAICSGNETDFFGSLTEGAVFEESCMLLTVFFPFEKSRFFDIRSVFSAQGILVDQYSSGTIIKAFGTGQSRRAHNALSDARTILESLQELSKQASKN